MTARRVSLQNRSDWPKNLVAAGFLRGDHATDFLSQKYRVPTVNLGEYEAHQDVRALVGIELCRAHTVVPVSRAGNALIVAMEDPTNAAAIDALRFASGFNIEPVLASTADIREAIERYYRPR